MPISQTIFRCCALLTLANAAFSFTVPKTYVLRTTMNVWDVDARDLNADGNLDIAVLSCDEKSFPLTKQVSVYLADSTGGYTETPSISLPLDASVGVCFFAEVDGLAPPELIAANSLGATVYHFDGKGFTKGQTLAFISLLPSGSKEPVFYETATIDLDGDGRDEWLIPAPSAFVVRTAEKALATIPCDFSSNLRDGTNLYINHKLPQFTAYSVGDDKSKSLTFLSDEFADFAHGENWSTQSRFKIPLNLEENWDSQSQTADIDGNGLPDLMVTQTKGTVNVTCLTQVYLAQSPYTYSDRPSATYSVSGLFASPLLADVNGDEKMDLVFIKVPYGLKLFANFLLRRKVSIVAEVHLFGKDGFAAEPDYTSDLTIDAPDGRQRVAYTLGDFTGDGNVDAAFGMGQDKMAIYLGGNNAFLSTKPAHTLSFPSFGEARTFTLDAGSKAEDIVLFHPAGKEAKRIEVVVFK